MLLLALPLALAADVPWYLDADGDTWGDPLGAVVAPDTAPPEGRVRIAGDCDDARADVNPDAAEACDGRDDDCDGDVDSTAVCPFAVSQWRGHAYLFVTTPATWPDAQASCPGFGYHLVTVASVEEDDWLDATADRVSTEKWWIGFNDREAEGQWVWEDGSAGLYTNWYPGEPNDALDGDEGAEEDAALINRFHPDRGWNDEPSTDVFRYVCESGATVRMYADADGDGWGDPGEPLYLASDVVPGTADNALDCDDGDATVHPGATETWYDGVDADCDGHSDHDADWDGHDAPSGGGEDCDDTTSAVHPGAADPWYDGVDSDCSGGSDWDQDGDGADAPEGGGDDCDDLDPARSPDAEDVPGDGVDQDCDGADATVDGDDTAGPTGDDTAAEDPATDKEDPVDAGCAGCGGGGAPGAVGGLLALVAAAGRRRPLTRGARA